MLVFDEREENWRLRVSSPGHIAWWGATALTTSPSYSAAAWVGVGGGVGGLTLDRVKVLNLKLQFSCKMEWALSKGY